MQQSMSAHGILRHAPDSDVLPRVTRLFQILTLIGSRRTGERIGRRALAEACEASVRTIQRDLDLLSLGAFAPIRYEATQHSYVLVDHGWTFPIMEWTPEDALALALARSLVSSPTLPHANLILQTLDKILASFSPALGELITQWAAVIQSSSGFRDHSRTHLLPLIEHAAGHETIEIDYESQSSGRSLRLVDPYQVERSPRDFWHLHGWCHRRSQVRTFSIDRIHAVRCTGQSFEIRELEWDAFVTAKGVFAGLRGDREIAVDVRFASEVAAYALRQVWPEGLQIEKETDGTARLTGNVLGTAIITEILRWRRHAVVLGGPELRECLKAEIRAITEIYA